MKKISAKVLSFILTAALILSFAPSVMVSAATTLPTGNSAGRLTDGLTVSYGDGADNMTVTTLLTDGFHYSLREKVGYGVDLAIDDEKIISLDNSKKVIEFEWETEQSVKRLEMWIWQIGAVKDYEIKIPNGTDWVTHSEGTLDQTQPVDGSDSKNRAGFYLIQFDAVKTSKLRFVVKNFRDGQTSAKIAEAIPRSSDNVNLLAKSTVNKENLGSVDAGLADGKYMSAYAQGFLVSNAADPGNINNTLSGINYRFNEKSIWPAYSSGSTELVIRSDPDDTTNTTWYLTRFPDSPQKINRVVIPIGNGTVEEIQILYSQISLEDKTDHMANFGYPSSATASIPLPGEDKGFNLATNVKGSFEKGTKVTVDIPDAEAKKAEYWLVKIIGKDSTVTIKPIEMYSLPSTTYMEEPTLTGNVAPGEKVSFKIFSSNNTDADSTVFFALYENEELNSVTKVGMPLEGIKEHSATYTVPAGVTGKLSVKAFFWNAKTLVPILNSDPLTLQSAQ